MARSGDQEQPSPEETRLPGEAPQDPAARISRLSARWKGARTADSQPRGAQAGLADQEDARRVPHQRHAPRRRASLPWLMPSLRPRTSLPGVPLPAEHDQGTEDPGEQGESRAAEPTAPVQPVVPLQPVLPDQVPPPDWDAWAARRPEVPLRAPQRTAADLRELAELGDLVGELAGLVRDLGTLIMGLITAAAGAGARQPRAFTVPPQLAELAGTHQELKAEQLALSARLESAAADRGGRAALRASLATLTERATRAVAVAAAVSFPPGQPPAPAASAGNQPLGSAQAPGSAVQAPGPAQSSETAAGSPSETIPRDAQEAPPGRRGSPPSTAPRDE